MIGRCEECKRIRFVRHSTDWLCSTDRRIDANQVKRVIDGGMDANIAEKRVCIRCFCLLINYSGGEADERLESPIRGD